MDSNTDITEFLEQIIKKDAEGIKGLDVLLEVDRKDIEKFILTIDQVAKEPTLALAIKSLYNYLEVKGLKKYLPVQKEQAILVVCLLGMVREYKFVGSPENIITNSMEIKYSVQDETPVKKARTETKITTTIEEESYIR
jgi:hypothetical protein